MLPAMLKSRVTLLRQSPSAMLLVKTLSTRQQCYKNDITQGFIKSRNASRHSIPSRPSLSSSVAILQRSFSLWNVPYGLMTASPLKRRLALVALGGTSLTALAIIGPFLLVGLGGIAAASAFRLWRFRKQQQQQQNGIVNDWPAFLNAFVQQQQVFGKEQLQLQTEAIKRLEMWAQTDQGRNGLIENGVHPERVMENVSIRGSYLSTTSSLTEIKIELDLRNSPGSVLIALAKLEGGNNITMTDIKMVIHNGIVFRIPLSITQQNRGGRVIEGEFYDV